MEEGLAIDMDDDVGLVVILTEAKNCHHCGFQIPKFNEAILPKRCVGTFAKKDKMFFHRACWKGRVT